MTLHFDDCAKNEQRVDRERAVACLVGLLDQEELEWLHRVLDERIGTRARAVLSVLTLLRLDHRDEGDVAFAEKIAALTATRGAKLIAVPGGRAG